MTLDDTTAVRDEVRTFLTKTFYVVSAEGLADDSSLVEQGLVDSTGVLEIIAFLDSRFGIHMEDDEIVSENLDSVNRLVAYILRRRS